MDEQLVKIICGFVFVSSVTMALFFKSKLRKQKKVGYVPQNEKEEKQQKTYQMMVYAMSFEALVVAPGLYFVLTTVFK
jgi:ABC-type Mn2+/Zn2+ transport system ATPase subunit